MVDSRPRVLIIEDEAKLAGLIALMLKRTYDVVSLLSAQEALDRIASGDRFDLILCDVMLPRLTGVDFVERLPAIAPDLVARVILMTGGAFTPRTKAFLEASSIPRIDKPFGLDELLSLVRAHCERHGRWSPGGARPPTEE
jgi:DNA-binding response OmpR family regulator